MKLIILWFRIRALEAFAQGQQDTLAFVADGETRLRMTMQHDSVLSEITRLKAERRRIKQQAFNQAHGITPKGLNKKIKDLIEAEPVILVKDGILDKNALNKSEITIDELEESVREHGVENISDVKLAILEVDGNISVVSFDKNNQTNFTRHKKKKNIRRKL